MVGVGKSEVLSTEYHNVTAKSRLFCERGCRGEVIFTTLCGSFGEVGMESHRGKTPEDIVRSACSGIL